jgi:hypothetical protein
MSDRVVSAPAFPKAVRGLPAIDDGVASFVDFGLTQHVDPVRIMPRPIDCRDSFDEDARSIGVKTDRNMMSLKTRPGTCTPGDVYKRESRSLTFGPRF